MACANKTCSSNAVASPPNQACARCAKIYSAAYWIAIAACWLIVTGATGLIGVTEAIGQGLCKPALSVKEAQFSSINPETLARQWTAVVSVDASRCKANFRGTFQIVFVRLSETAPDMEFRERFVWTPPSVNVSVEFGRDEAVERYWIDNVSPCICRK